jgi:Fe2+ or Zn2+ uptake regulation protein
MIVLSEKLNKLGLKNTTPILAVYKILEKNHTPISAQEIWKKLHKKNNLVSIYRILERLSEAKLIRQDIITDKKQRPEKVYYLAEKHHHHFVCQKCTKIFCLPCPINIKLPKNFKLNTHQLLVNGWCPNCHN